MNTSPANPHLCQPNRDKSCGWCCGLYNVLHSGRDVLHRKLGRRTKRFAETARTVKAILDFSEGTLKKEQSCRIDPDFYSCEFIGFLDGRESRVGCMLHPLYPGNRGVDWRGLSFHGAMACQGFYCRSYRELSNAEKAIILDAIQDWYLYGLVISDADYSKTLFRMTEAQLGRAVEPESLLSSRATEVIHEFFHWKIDWPFRRPEASAKGSGVYHTSQENDCSEIQHCAREVLPLVHLIFRCLHSEFRSDSDRAIAEQMVDQLFSHLAKLV